MTTFWVLLAIALYFVPAIVASRRRVTNENSVYVINLFFGWTLVGWVVALAMALRTSTEPPAERLPRGSYSVRNIGRRA